MSKNNEKQINSKELLIKKDSDTFDKRLKNFSYIFSIDSLVNLEKIPHAVDSFRNEARINFINGCYRSCIFSCASAVERAIKEELIISSLDPEETLWEFEIKRVPFGKLVDKTNRNKKLKKIREEANFLRELRNEIAVHPLQIPKFPTATKNHIVLTNMMMARSFKKMVKYLDKETRNEILNQKISTKDNIILKEILQDPTTPKIEIIWSATQENLLELLAATAFAKMTLAIHRIYSK
ncbi:MAG: hypothetical protein NWF02_07320 [Candidatus Bathyarchaeota archaeon]|nr:hypothetical protein [Candidatus Bathyarchaeum sp.]